ncbi:MAG: hypothetical protein ACI970_000296 [Myxococcota bacterium]|jgi:hypothetical protein
MLDTTDRPTLASAIKLLLLGIGVVILDLRIGAFDVLPDPVGQLLIAIAVIRTVKATGKTPFAMPVAVLAGVALILSTILEIAVLDGRVAVGTVAGPEGGELLDTALIVTQLLVTIALAQHLRRCLDGIASDRWRQVTIAFGAALVMVPVVSLTEDLLLVLLQAAVIVTALALLVLSLLATRALALDDSAPVIP